MKPTHSCSLLALTLSLGVACAPEKVPDDDAVVGSIGGKLSGDSPVVDNGTGFPEGAVGQFSTSSGRCTATLIARSQILTAKHCVPDNNTGAMNFRINSTNYPVQSIAVHPTGGANPGDDHESPHDLAVATLTGAVSTVDVPIIPRVFFGAMQAAVDSDSVFGPAFLVGYGGFGEPSYDSDDFDNYGSYAGTTSWDGNRRTGEPIQAVELVIDECGGLIEGKCNDDFEWQNIRGHLTNLEPGDSGGPLFIRDAQGWLVAGVAAEIMYDQPPWGATQWDTDVWAATGNVGGPSNTNFIVGQMGGDADGDGVPENVDNCPATACSSPDLCANPDQLDTDDDGVGEVCDNCPASHNPSQSNGDGDRYGDQCDNCPGVSTPSLSDMDADGIGDACDACDLPNPYATCSRDSECDGASVCIMDTRPGELALGRCDAASDEDSDGIPDACDTCQGFPNTSSINSNAIAEERERAAGNSLAVTMGDQCDPVPIVRFLPQRFESSLALDELNNDNGPDDLALIEGETIVGGGGGGFSEQVTYRHCSCYHNITGVKLDLEECVGTSAFAQCSWRDPENNTVSWRGMRTADFNTRVETAPFGSTTETFSDTPEAVSRLWYWRDDVLSGRIQSESTCTSFTDCRTYGAVLSTTDAAGHTNRSLRDMAFDLRDVFQIFSTPAFVFKEVEPVRELGRKCFGGGCFERYLRADLIRRISVFPLISQITDVSLISLSEAGLHVFPREGQPVDISNFVSSAAWEALAAVDTQWLSPVESGAVLRSHGGFVSEGNALQASLLPTEFSAGTEPDLIFSTPNGLRSLQGDVLGGDKGGDKNVASVASVEPASVENDLSEPSSIMATEIAAAPTPADYAPISRSNVRGVFSALETATYMVGGVKENGVRTGGIWKYSALDRSWVDLASTTDHVPTAEVFAVGYFQPEGKLYVLDLLQQNAPLFGIEPTSPRNFFEALAAIKHVRLVEYDTHTGQSRELAKWPYLGIYKSLDLAADADGDLIIVGANKRRYRMWRFEVGEHGLIPKGTKSGRGRVAGRLVMGDTAPTLAILRGDKVKFPELSPEAFGRHRSCRF